MPSLLPLSHLFSLHVQANAASREALKIAQASSQQIQARKRLAHHIRVIAQHNDTAIYGYGTSGTNFNSSTTSNGSSTQNSAITLLRVWAPRCLLVVSHVAFFDPFRAFLKNLLLASVALRFHTATYVEADDVPNDAENISDASDSTLEHDLRKTFLGTSDGLGSYSQIISNNGSGTGSSNNGSDRGNHSSSTPAASTTDELKVDLLLPIERHVANFCGEVPLPPRGQIEVLAALPQSPDPKKLYLDQAKHLEKKTDEDEDVTPAPKNDGWTDSSAAGPSNTAARPISTPFPAPLLKASSTFVPRERGITPPRSRSNSVPASAANAALNHPRSGQPESSANTQSARASEEIGPGQLALKRSAPNELPTLACSLRPLLACLSADNILVAFECLLTEEKVNLLTNIVTAVKFWCFSI